jgi:23S rRNA pseudouridine1911/1915/1917 synthase
MTSFPPQRTIPFLRPRKDRGHASRRKFSFIVPIDQAKKRLDVTLADWLPEALGRPVSKAKIRKLIMAGAVTLNGSPVRSAAVDLSPGIKVEADVDPGKLFGDQPSHDKKFELTPEGILFEDADLIAVSKPPGLPSHPTVDEARDNLFIAVTRFLKKRDGDAPYLGIHHRLDRDTSGIVLFTKSRQVNTAIAESFSRHQVVKIYQALTIAPARVKVPEEWTIRHYLGKVSAKSKRAIYGAVRSGGDFAETSFRIIEHHPHGIWIEAIPKTGRTHQIRVHLAEYGLPILGDDLYRLQKINDPAPRLMLHASQLRFPHPLTRAEISVKSPLPEDFKQCLATIRRRGTQ